VLVALMLITIALLGMAGSTTLALRQVTDAAGRRSATHSAVSRLGALASQGCSHATSGSVINAVQGQREHWTVVASATFVRVIDTVVWSSPRGTRTLSLESAFPC
jgi:Tfp pilus assembly protein PilV